MTSLRSVPGRAASRNAGALAAAALLAAGLTACVQAPQSPEDQARDIAERWVAASDRGDEDSAQALSCGAMLGGVNGDTAGSESHALAITPQEDGQFIVTVTKSYPDYPDLVTNLAVRTDGELCVSWVR